MAQLSTRRKTLSSAFRVQLEVCSIQCLNIVNLNASLGGDAGGAGSEDCLKVNVYAPLNATKESNCKQ